MSVFLRVDVLAVTPETEPGANGWSFGSSRHSSSDRHSSLVAAVLRRVMPRPEIKLDAILVGLWQWPVAWIHGAWIQSTAGRPR
ncbi:hypothetical protein HPB52_013578 [Rhipicephalus sanguineus]|uniref:Uncharacterized protein n=1 Tax=Rhipicephalus sanguineus TaxID=34632 RepID=A0A9D4PNV2_RHISA|nr:hypothetical protein HPB52_013578 [Rhipicephalus sanguineus]